MNLLPSDSVDIVYPIDTMEHLSKPKEILGEVFRVLKPGGVFLVHFNPWLNPHGSHLDDIIPFPWAHAVFSMNTLLNVAERLYDSPVYETSCYYLDTRSVSALAAPRLRLAGWFGDSRECLCSMNSSPVCFSQCLQNREAISISRR